MKKLEIEHKMSTEQKSFLISVFGDIFQACFAPNIEGCETYGELRRLIFQNSDGIGSYLDLELKDEDEEDRKDREIEGLEGEVDKLEHKLAKYETGSLLDNWKGEILQKYLKDYTPIQLEELFENNVK